MEGALSRFVLAQSTHEARVGTLWSPGAAWCDVTAGTGKMRVCLGRSSGPHSWFIDSV